MVFVRLKNEMKYKNKINFNKYLNKKIKYKPGFKTIVHPVAKAGAHFHETLTVNTRLDKNRFNFFSRKCELPSEVDNSMV